MKRICRDAMVVTRSQSRCAIDEETDGVGVAPCPRAAGDSVPPTEMSVASPSRNPAPREECASPAAARQPQAAFLPTQTRSPKSTSSKSSRVSQSRIEVLKARAALARAELELAEARAEEASDDDDETVVEPIDNNRIDKWLDQQQPNHESNPGPPNLIGTPQGLKPLTQDVVVPILRDSQDQGPIAHGAGPQPTHVPHGAGPQPTHVPHGAGPQPTHVPHGVGPQPKVEVMAPKVEVTTPGLAQLAEAIVLATKSNPSPVSAPRFLSELPQFGGETSEWLPFKAAYHDTKQYFSTIENAARLRRALRGAAKEAVSSLFLGNYSPDLVVDRLESRFGRPDVLVRAELEKIRALPRLTDSPRDVCVFASRVENIVATVEALEKFQYLYNPEMQREIEEKLTPILRSRWFDFDARSSEMEPCLVKMRRFLRLEGDLNAPHAKAEPVRPARPSTPTSRAPMRQKAFVGRDEVSNRDGNITQCPICNSKEHGRSVECSQFKSANTDGRWELAKKHKLCFRCLRPRPWKHTCKNKVCDTDGCTLFHHKMLHHNKAPETQEETVSTSNIVLPTTGKIFTFTYLKVLPVTVSGPKGEVDTYALLDDGSTCTLVMEEIAQKVGAVGTSDPFCIEGIGGVRIDASTSQRVPVGIRGRYQGPEDNIKVLSRTIKDLNIAPQQVMQESLSGCTHLSGITGELTYEVGTPMVLIGQDNWELLLTEEVRRGKPNQPVASRTALGWVLHGRRASSDKTYLTHFRERVSHVQRVDDNLESMVRQHYDLEALGVQPKTPRSDPEVRALSILQSTTELLPEGVYQTGLLWRSDDTSLPDNYQATLHRLEGVERKLAKDPTLQAEYKKQIQRLIDNNYIEEAPDSQTEGRTWYLPHCAIVKPGKVRIVYDAAARTKGVCLNDVLLTGPDFLQSLLGILMRFRQRPVAVVADIRDMFLRIKVRPSDRDALRFLWRDQPGMQPTQYRMSSVLFGATCSPCTAIYVKDHNADRHAQEFPQAVDPIKRHHYMDDYLQSFDNINEAKEIISAVDKVHRRGGFELAKWSSNEPTVLQDLVSEIYTNKDKQLFEGEKILGMIWSVNKDTLSYNLNFRNVDKDLLEQGRTPTRRELLRSAMSLYDPLGLAAPITIQAKHIFQQTCRDNIGWDDPLSESCQRDWKAWVNSLQELATLKIPRCHTGYCTARTLQLHTFVDASKSTYAAACYWRAEDEAGQVHISLATAKARVAPLKVTTIPRLELQAALLGSRLAHTVENEHDRKPARRVFWSDSQTVLSWIRAGARVFKPFVAHRIAEIEERTSVEEWCWVPTKENVADDATRATPPQFTATHRWFRGPTFLYGGEEEWPTRAACDEAPTDLQTEQERVAVLTSSKSKIRIKFALPAPERFSSWLRLTRATARVLQFIATIRKATKVVAVTRVGNQPSDDDWSPKDLARRAHRAVPPPKIIYSPHVKLEIIYIRQAETLQVKALQEECFENDIRKVREGQPPSPQSRLRQLALQIDGEGVLRLKSRIGAAGDISRDQREPAVLDGGHYYCRLYVHWVHVQAHHAGVEMVTNEVRQRFHVLRLRPTVRTVLKSCQQCRIMRAVPPTPSTGNLPAARVAHHKRPFTYTGLDYFGPLSVTVGRTHQKRYGALFTCLTTRAVHIEIAGSLSTDSAVMALRRMMARRGCPEEIWSDNGTNFRGADSELRRAALQAVETEAEIRAISWRFIPPGAPFMGGAWERMVRSVKTALATTLHEQHPREEVLATLLAEAENTINSRPLTHVPVGPEDETALTPNHFILGGPSRVPVSGSFCPRNLLRKEEWKASQHLANEFWRRWMKEALPLLQQRREPHGKGAPLRLGDVVIVMDGSLPRNMWPMGIIEALHTGADGVARSAEVRTGGRVMIRPTKKLIVLPTDAASCVTDPK